MPPTSSSSGPTAAPSAPTRQPSRLAVWAGALVLLAPFLLWAVLAYFDPVARAAVMVFAILCGLAIVGCLMTDPPHRTTRPPR